MRELTPAEAALVADQTKPEPRETPGQSELRRQYERDRPASTQLACQLGIGVIILGLLAGVVAIFTSNLAPAAAAFGLLQFGVLLLILGTLQAILRRTH